MAKAHRSARTDHIHWNAKMGPYRSALMTGGIIETCARLGVFGAFWRVVALYCCGGAGRFGGCAASGRHSAHLSGCGENPGAAFDIISDGGEADLQTRLCEPSPAHASKAVASLPRSEDFFDAATNAVDRPVPSLKTRQRFRLVSTPHAGHSDAHTAALGLDGLAKSLSPIRAVCEYLAWLVRQGLRSGFCHHSRLRA